MSGKQYDIFISYRRSDGKDKARILDLAFKNAGYRTFLDYNNIGANQFDKVLKEGILEAPIFIMVLTHDYFFRCDDENDWVKEEIMFALNNGKKIIPINYDKVLEKVPDYLNNLFKKQIETINFVTLHGDDTFEGTVKYICDNIIKSSLESTPESPSIKITQIDLANIKESGYMISDWEVDIKASEAEFLAPRIHYESDENYKYKLDIKWIKLATPNSENDNVLLRAPWSPEKYTQSFERFYNKGTGIDYFNSWKYDGNIPWPAGKYAIEIWCEDNLLKRKEFRIY